MAIYASLLVWSVWTYVALIAAQKGRETDSQTMFVAAWFIICRLVFLVGATGLAMGAML